MKDLSSATRPGLQGAMSVLMLWQASLRLPMPQFIDPGITVITGDTGRLARSRLAFFPRE